MNSEKKCRNCLKGKPISLNNDYICMLKGIVSADYYCNKHRYITSAHIKMSLLKCKDCDNFVVVEEKLEGLVGTCNLFTIRKFNGNTRRACSKIVTNKSLF